jgi:hypothetical protein
MNSEESQTLQRNEWILESTYKFTKYTRSQLDTITAGEAPVH